MDRGIVMQMNLEWSVFKSVCTARSLSMQYIDMTGSYALMAFDDCFEVCCNLVESADITDFETNYKATGNKPPVTLTAPFAAKTFGTKRLFARNTGKAFTITTGSNDLSYTMTYAWAKITGLECIGAEIGDYAELRVYDNSSGTYSGVPNALLNQFGYTLYMAKDYYARSSQFDSDIYAGMVLKITYNSISNKNIYLNYLINEVKT